MAEDPTREHEADDPTRAVVGELAAAEAEPASAGAAYTRSQVLAGAVVGVGGVLGAVITLPALGFLLAPVFKASTFHPIDVGPLSNFPDDGKYHTVSFSNQPVATDLSGRVAFIRNHKGAVTALSNTCMHLGCPVQNYGTSFACPCHGGQYDSEGRRIAGPPVRPLNRYDTKVENGHLILGQLWAMDDQLNKHQLKGPGQAVGGLYGLLYPPAPQ